MEWQTSGVGNITNRTRCKQTGKTLREVNAKTRVKVKKEINQVLCSEHGIGAICAVEDGKIAKRGIRWR
jgi:hypothetical protein